MSETASPINKNLNAQALGVAGRQSELNELALTFGFNGLDIDVAEIADRAAKHDLQTATMFLHLPVGQFVLPISLGGDEATFAKGLERLRPMLPVAKAIKATRFVHVLECGSDELPYHENFERHRTRISQIAHEMNEHGIRLGLGLNGAAGERSKFQYQFVHEADDLLTFIKTIGADNVGLALDSWHWKLTGGTLDQIRELGVANIVAVTLADIAADVDLDGIETTQRVLPHEGGLVDNKGLVALLADLGYQGPLTLSPCPTTVSGARDQVVERASKDLDRLWSPEPEVAEEEDAAQEGEAVASAE